MIEKLEIANDGNVLCRLQNEPQESYPRYSSHRPEIVCLQATKDVLRAKLKTERELGGIWVSMSWAGKSKSLPEVN
jgi:hypothetical protein